MTLSRLCVRLPSGGLALGLLVVLLAAAPAGAQRGTEVRGQVRGADGQPLAGATLVFHHLDSNQQHRSQADARGGFLARGLPAGRYRVAVLQQGRIVAVMAGVEVGNAGSPVTLDFDLSAQRPASEPPPVLDVNLQRRLQEYEEEQARRTEVRDFYRQGVHALERQDYELAINQLEAARKREPGEALYHAQLGAALAAADRLPEAIAAYQQAVSLEPKDPAIRNNLGAALARAGRIEEALDAFLTAARQAGDVRAGEQPAAAIYFNWAATLHNAGRYREAAERWRQATRTPGVDPTAFYFLGESLYQTAPRRGEGADQKVEPRPEMVAAFQRYLELAPEGKYAARAADYLRRLGMARPEPAR